MGSAAFQGRLWGAQALDWAQTNEQTALPLFGAVLDAARVKTGDRVLDAGSGAGLAALLAALRGASVAAVDASASQLAIARERLPDADIREADLEDLPFDDDTFDAAVAVNSVFYAADLLAAMRELARVVRPDGYIVVAGWGPAEECEYAAVIRGMGPLLPPPPPGAPPGGPFAFSTPGALERLFADAGVRAVEHGLVACPFVYPDMTICLRALYSSGVIQRAIEHSGATLVRVALDDAMRPYTQPDGSVRYNNVFLWVSGQGS